MCKKNMIVYESNATGMTMAMAEMSTFRSVLIFKFNMCKFYNQGNFFYMTERTHVPRRPCSILDFNKHAKLQIWNYQWLTDPLTDWLTDRGRC